MYKDNLVNLHFNNTEGPKTSKMYCFDDHKKKQREN